MMRAIKRAVDVTEPAFELYLNEKLPESMGFRYKQSNKRKNGKPDYFVWRHTELMFMVEVMAKIPHAPRYTSYLQHTKAELVDYLNKRYPNVYEREVFFFEAKWRQGMDRGRMEKADYWQEETAVPIILAFNNFLYGEGMWYGMLFNKFREPGDRSADQKFAFVKVSELSDFIDVALEVTDGYRQPHWTLEEFKLRLKRYLEI